jgi:uncharacterized protein GlcG (DUF336 family)
VTVCDADGRLVAFQRMDGTLAEAHRASYGKALASATSGRPSGDSIELSEDFKDFRTATVIGEAVALLRRPGGLPIIRAGIHSGSSLHQGDRMLSLFACAANGQCKGELSWQIAIFGQH